MASEHSSNQRRLTAAAAGLWAVLLPPPAAVASDGKGWIWGGTLGGRTVRFPGSEDLALAIGPVTQEEVLAIWGSATVIRTRDAAIVREGAVAEGAVAAVPFPRREAQGSFSLHGGYAFSRRLALLLDVGLSAGFSDTSFGQIIGGGVLRYAPVPRLWVQAGVGSGQLWGHYEHDKTIDLNSGAGVLAAAGVSLLQRESWALDVEARFSHVPYEGFSSSMLHLAVGATRRTR